MQSTRSSFHCSALGGTEWGGKIITWPAPFTQTTVLGRSSKCLVSKVSAQEPWDEDQDGSAFSRPFQSQRAFSKLKRFCEWLQMSSRFPNESSSQVWSLVKSFSKFYTRLMSLLNHNCAFLITKRLFQYACDFYRSIQIDMYWCCLAFKKIFKKQPNEQQNMELTIC